VTDMRTRSDLQGAYIALSLMHMNDEQRAEVMRGVPRLTQQERAFTQPGGQNVGQDVSDFRNMVRILDELFDPRHHRDIYRSADSTNRIPTTDRTIAEYYDQLYPDMNTFEDFFIDISQRKAERWLEIGPGDTYKQLGSLLNAIRLINDKITIVGSDLLYAGDSAARIDRARGSQRLDKEWSSQHQLVGAAAQMMPFADSSFDEVITSWVFDKFNEETLGKPQAFREVARVLRDGGICRVCPVESEDLTTPFMRRYFDVLKQHRVMIGRGDSVLSAVLLRKRTSLEERKKLQEEIDAWVRQYGPKTGST